MRDGRTVELEVVIGRLPGDDGEPVLPGRPARRPPARTCWGSRPGPSTTAARERLNIDQGGVAVLSTVEGGPAERAGVVVGDVVLMVDNVPVDSARELDRVLAELDGRASGAGAGAARVRPHVPGAEARRTVSADGSDRPRLTLLYREGCHLCEEMEALLHELLPAQSFALERIDIDEHPALLARHHVRVPVLSLGGAELCHHFLDLAAVSSALAGLQSTG